MLQEARKREKAAAALSALSFAANVAQSPQDFVKSGYEQGPGTQLVRTMMRRRSKAEKSLDNPRVVSRGAKLKEGKTFQQFIEEAYLSEMRKEDKVKGEKKTPLTVTVKSGRVEKQPEGSETKWKVRKSERTSLTPKAAHGRTKQGMKDPTNPYSGADSAGSTLSTYSRHAHGGGGSGAKAPGRFRGVGKIERQKMDKAQREKGERPIGSGPSPAYKVALKRAQRARSSGGGR